MREHGRARLPGWLLVLLLTGCVTRPAPLPSPPPSSTEAHTAEAARQTWLHAHPGWAFSGRVALRQPGGKGGSGRIEWQQQGSRYRIRLSAPVTRQSWQLTGDLISGSGRIEGIEGGPLDSLDAEALLWEATGWDIPVHSLSEWVRGISQGAGTGTLDPEGRPQQVQHAGWNVTWALWHPPDDTLPSLPRRIEAVRADGGAEAARIRLMIDHWAFP